MVDWSGIDRIRDTTMLGLNIGVLSGVSGGIMKNMNKFFGGTVRRRSKRKRKYRKKKR